MTVFDKARSLIKQYTTYNSRQRNLLRLQSRDYSALPVSESTNRIVDQVMDAASQINASNPAGWNFYSNALRREVVHTFELAVEELSQKFTKINYLEIGSAQGLSMSLIGSLLRGQSVLGRLVSADPYFDQGYREGKHGVWGRDVHVKMDKSARERAKSLYRAMDLDVELVEAISTEALRLLIQGGNQFHLIYIDGSHEGLDPMVDFGLSAALLHPEGVIMLDDHHWPNVYAVKDLCDQHCVKVYESWKVAAYKLGKAA